MSGSEAEGPRPDPMTHFLKDILRQPAELRRCLDLLDGAARSKVAEAASLVRGTRHVFLTGIGSSWHAALNVSSLLFRHGLPVFAVDASELLHFTRIPPDSVILALSRSGRSAEIVGLLSKAREAGAPIVGFTNSPGGPLAVESRVSLEMPVALDHGISVNTYSSLALAAGVVASTVTGHFDSNVSAALMRALHQADAALGSWRDRIECSPWLDPGASFYFMGRGASVGSCYEARLLWEEGVKAPATAMGTGAFRHGPQEMVASGARFGMWLDPKIMRSEDLAVARDLHRLGAPVMLIGHGLPPEAGGLVCELPETPCGWQFVLDAMPAQLAAERMARVSGVDCDSFRICSYIIEDESGLLPAEVAPQDGAK